LRKYQRAITSSCHSHTSRINREREVVRSTCKFSWVYATSSLIHLQKPSRTCPHSSSPASHPDNQPVLGPLQTRKQSVTERKASTTCHPHLSTYEYILSQDTSINIVVVAFHSYSAQNRYTTTAAALFLNFRPYRIVPYPQPLPPKARYDRHTRPSKKT